MDRLLELFRWDSKDEYTRDELDFYIVKNIDTHGLEYILKIICTYERLQNHEELEYKELIKDFNLIESYMYTYLRLYFVDDIWNEITTKFIPKMKDIKMSCPEYLYLILSFFNKKDITKVLDMFCKKCYNIYIKSGGILTEKKSNTISDFLFLLSELITVNNSHIKDYIKASNYKIEKPQLEFQYNLLNLMLLLPTYMSNNYNDDIKITLETVCFMLRKKYFKNLVVDYLSNILEVYKFRTKAYYYMVLRRDTEQESYLINVLSIILLLWGGARTTQPHKINNLSMNYIYCKDCELSNLIDEISLNNFNDDIISNTKNTDYDFFTKCFFMSLMSSYIVLFPLIKYHLKIKQKLDNEQLLVDNMIIKWGSYTNIPLIDRAIYDKYVGYIKIRKKEKKSIERILDIPVIKMILPKMFEDFSKLGNRLLEDKNYSEFGMIPEFVLDLKLECLMFYTLDLSCTLEFPNTLEFLARTLGNKKLVNNPYLHCKMIELICLNSSISKDYSNVVYCKKKIILGLISVFLDIKHLLLCDAIRSKIILLINYFIRINEDYKYELINIYDKEESISKFVYIVITNFTHYFDEIKNSFTSIIDLSDSEEFNDYTQIIYDISDIHKYNSFLNHNIIMIENILKIPEIKLMLLKDNFLSKIINSTNYVIMKLMGKNNEKEFIYDVLKYQFNKNTTIQFSLKLIYEFLEQSYYKNMFCLEDTFFDRETLEKTIEYSWNKSLLNIDEYDKLREFLEEVGIKIKERRDLLVEIDIPDEYLDPIMQTLIKEPIILPETNTIVDKSVIFRHLIEDETNPYTRSKLTKKELEKYNKKPENIEKLNEFKLKLTQWKKNVFEK